MTADHQCSAIILEADYTFDIRPLQKCVVILDLSSTVGFLCHMPAIYLQCPLEVKMSGVIHGMGGLDEILLLQAGRVDQRDCLGPCYVAVQDLLRGS